MANATGSAVTIYTGSYTGKARLVIDDTSVSYPSNTQYKVSYKLKLQMYNRSGHSYKGVSGPGISSKSGVSGGSYSSGTWYTANSWSGSYTGTRGSGGTYKISCSGQIIKTNTSKYVSMSVSHSISYTAQPAVNVTATASAGTGGYVSPTSLTVTQGNSVTFTASAYAGYHFSNWNTGDTAATITKVISANTSYIAYFTADTYTLSFNSNGGSTIASKTVSYNSSIGVLPQPTKANYTFLHWTDYYGNIVYDNTIYTQTSNSTLYAVWSANYKAGSWNTATYCKRTGTGDYLNKNLEINLFWNNGLNGETIVYPTRLTVQKSDDNGNTWTTLDTVTTGLNTNYLTKTYTNAVPDIAAAYLIRYTLYDGFNTISYTDFISVTGFLWRIPSTKDKFQIGVPLEIQGQQLIDYVYPVGSLLITTDSTYYPSTKFQDTTWTMYTDTLGGQTVYCHKRTS